MPTLDDLAFRAEVEADVLRAVSHLPPEAACQFLLDLVLKIRRAGARDTAPPEAPARANDAPPVAQANGAVSGHAAPAVPDPPPAPEVAAPAPLAASRSAVILKLVGSGRAKTVGELVPLVAAAMGEADSMPVSKNRTGAALWSLVNARKAVVRGPGDSLRLA